MDLYSLSFASSLLTHPVSRFADQLNNWSLNGCMEHCKRRCVDYALSGRVQYKWKESVMLAGIAVSVSGVALTIFSGSSFIWGSFAVLGLICIFGAYCLHDYANLKDLEQSIGTLRQENNRFRETNQELLRTNGAFQETHQQFQTTNRDLTQNNTRLTQQVTELTLQVTQLTDSAERIRVELSRFQQENGHLYNNVQGLDQSLLMLNHEITASRALCGQISHHFADQQQSFSSQLAQLQHLLTQIRDPHSVTETLNQLIMLREQLATANAQLAAVRGEYQGACGRLIEVGNALENLRTQFSAENSQLHGNIEALSQERVRIHNLVNAAFTAHPQLATTSHGGNFIPHIPLISVAS